jgi:chlorobactene glucosyltransferase
VNALLDAFLWSLLVGATILVLLYQGVAILLAYRLPTVDREARDPRGDDRRSPGPSVIVPARNEELDLPACLDSLLAQELPPREIFVVEDGSTDRTREVALARAPRVSLVEPPPLPPDWVGKSWSCWTGAQRAAGDWLLFLDADVRLAPSALGVALRRAEAEQADLFSFGPEIEMRSFWERTMLPFFIQLVLVHLGLVSTNHDDGGKAFANGQFLLIRRAMYDRVGGHAAGRSIVSEDLALAERVRSVGGRIRFVSARRLAATRMYRDRAEIFEGLLKNLPGTQYSAAREGGFAAALIGFFLLPLAVLPLGLALGSLPVVALGLVLWVALFGKHVAFARAVGAPGAYGLLFPLAAAVYAGFALITLGRGWTGRSVVWKGRAYPVRRGPPASGNG